MTAAASYPDYDGMTVYFQPPTPEVEAENANLQQQRDQQQAQQCSSGSGQQQGFRVSMQGKLQKVAALADRFQNRKQVVVDVIRQHAGQMQDLNRRGY